MLIGIVATAITFFVVAYVLPQIDFTGDVIQLVILAAVFGVVNALVKPIVKLLTWPINMMTLGLFGFVVNAALLLAVAYVSDAFGIPFSVGGFPPNLTADAIIAAFIGSIAIGIVGAIVGMIVRD
jgi:putative membrane protein